MPSQSELPADRDARLEKAVLERDRAVALLREWRTDYWLKTGFLQQLDKFQQTEAATRKFLESLT